MRGRNKMVMGAVVLLAGFMMFIVWGNYMSQVELHQASLERFSESSAKEAAAFSHFFSERQNDLEDLSGSRELLAYFENEALGMSKEYGLWASLVGISELLDRFVRKKELAGKSLYKRIAFVDEAGDLLADNGAVPEGQECCGVLVPSGLLPGRAEILLKERADGIDLVMVLPYIFKGRSVGTLLAWLNTDEILPILMEHSRGDAEDGFCFFAYKHTVYSPLHSVPPQLDKLITKGWLPRPGKVVERIFPTEYERAVDFLVTRSPVDGTPFCLFSLVPKEDVLGTMTPWKLLLYTVLLALLLLGGGGIVLKVSARNLVLNVKVDEAAKQARNIEEKNRQLEAEVSARKMAEEALHKVNDELEARVEKRTSALKKRTRALGREVVERREAEAAMRLIFNNTHDAIFIHDIEGDILDVNQRMLELYRVTREEALSLSIAEDLSDPGNDTASLEQKWQRVVDGEEVFFDWIARRPRDGSLFDVEVALNRIELGGQTVILANVHDISEQRRRQAQQEEHQEFLNTIFEGIGAAIFVFDPDRGAMVDCNAVGENLLGLSREDIIEASCKTMYPFEGDMQKDLLCPDWHDKNEYEEGVLAIPDKAPIPVSRRTFDIHIGGKTHLVQVVFDITDRSNLERKLNIAQKLESIGQLASGIAHEINTPIQYIGDSIRFVKEVIEDMYELIAIYDAALDDACDAVEKNITEDIAELKDDMDYDFVLEETPKACDRALEGVQRVASIVLAMKNFSHPGEEKARAVNINKAIENTVTVTRNEWKYVAELHTHLAPDLPLVHCFPGGINQVLLNIIVNAAHAIAGSGDPEEKGTITVTTLFDTPVVEIRISDSGCGISKDNLTKVFDPFFTTKEVGKGTGQGLAIVHDIIVEKHDGSIDVESEEGEGTTFIIRLPLGEAE